MMALLRSAYVDIAKVLESLTTLWLVILILFVIFIIVDLVIFRAAWGLPRGRRIVITVRCDQIIDFAFLPLAALQIHLDQGEGARPRLLFEGVQHILRQFDLDVLGWSDLRSWPAFRVRFWGRFRHGRVICGLASVMVTVLSSGTLRATFNNSLISTASIFWRLLIFKHYSWAWCRLFFQLQLLSLLHCHLTIVVKVIYIFFVIFAMFIELFYRSLLLLNLLSLIRRGGSRLLLMLLFLRDYLIYAGSRRSRASIGRMHRILMFHERCRFLLLRDGQDGWLIKVVKESLLLKSWLVNCPIRGKHKTALI